MKQRTEKPQNGQRVQSLLERPAGIAEFSRRDFLQVVAGGAAGAFLAASCAGADVVESSCPAVEDEFTTDSIKTIGLKCAKYRLSRGVDKLTDFYRDYKGDWINHIWDVGAYMSGVIGLYRLTRDQYLLDKVTEWADKVNWTPSGGTGARDNSQCPLQTFVDVYLLDRKPANLDKMVKPALDNVTSMLSDRSRSGRRRWALVDWLYMSPTAVPRVYEAYKEVPGANVDRLLDWLGVDWKDCASFLFSDQYKLWWRDGKYKDAKTANGSPVFWSGGNAWGAAGLARVIEYMPASHKDTPYYIKQFQDICEALRKAPSLGKDGMWRTSLMDYNQFPDQDSISSAYFGYCFAFGINRGYLDRGVYEPYVRTAWSALVRNIAADGRLQWCQRVTEQPTSVSQNNSAPEGEGAFMLMAEELAKMLAPERRSGREAGPTVAIDM